MPAFLSGDIKRAHKNCFFIDSRTCVWVEFFCLKKMEWNALLFIAYVNNLVTRVTDRVFAIYLTNNESTHFPIVSRSDKRSIFAHCFLFTRCIVFIGVAFPAISIGYSLDPNICRLSYWLNIDQSMRRCCIDQLCNWSRVVCIRCSSASIASNTNLRCAVVRAF